MTHSPSYRSRAAYAARAAVAFIVTAATMGGLYFFKYEIISLAEPARYGFWIVTGGIFIALCGATTAIWTSRRNRRIAVFLAAALGFLAGLFWCFATVFPMGVFPGRFLVPIIVIWPLSGTLAFAYAEAAQASASGPARAGPGFLFALLTIAWVFTVKAGFDALGERVDFARMIPDRRYRDPSGLGISASPIGNCNDPAPPRLASSIDSSAALTPLGSFEWLQRTVSRNPGYIGHRIDLWRTDTVVVGVMAEALGGTRAWPQAQLEDVRFNASTGSLTFNAFFRDGYLVRFTGTLDADAIRGTLTTVDAACIRRVLVANRVELPRADTNATYPLGHAQPRRIAQMRLVYPNAYARLPATPTLAVRTTRLLVPRLNWVGPATGAARFEGIFADSAQLQRALRNPYPVGVFNNDAWSPARLLVESQTLPSGRTSWLVAGPVSVVLQYAAQMQETGVRELHYALVTPHCCSN